MIAEGIGITPMVAILPEIATDQRRCAACIPSTPRRTASTSPLPGGDEEPYRFRFPTAAWPWATPNRALTNTAGLDYQFTAS